MKIVIFQPMLKFYRVPLFEKLYQLLSLDGHELRLVFGTPWEEELKRNDNVVVKNDYCFFEKSHWFLNNRVHFMKGTIGHILWADIIITEQANRHLFNYFLIILSFFKIKAFAFWGHGASRQGNPKSLRERFKKALVTQTDWWFAYTSSVAGYLQDLGFSKERISILNNSVDTRAFKQVLNTVTAHEFSEFKQKHNLSREAQVGIFCGSLHQNKEIEFLLESAKLIKQKNTRFILMIGGDGKDKRKVEHYAQQFDFIVYLGALHGKQKALAFKCADVFLNPGVVGLAILDAFSAGLPIFTTRQAKHCPEIDYLQNGSNGIIADLDIENYANLVISAFESKGFIDLLKKNALASSKLFSIENMANNFFEGIKIFMDRPYS